MGPSRTSDTNEPLCENIETCTFKPMCNTNKLGLWYCIKTTYCWTLRYNLSWTHGTRCSYCLYLPTWLASIVVLPSGPKTAEISQYSSSSDVLFEADVPIWNGVKQNGNGSHYTSENPYMYQMYGLIYCV